MEKKQKLIRKFFIYLNKNTNYYMNLQKNSKYACQVPFEMQGGETVTKTKES